MDRIAELDRGEIRFYGGNFTAYEEAVHAEREVAEKNVRNAEQEVKREKREMQQARERAARRAEQRRPEPQERRPAEDLRRRDEAQRAGVGGQGGRDARRAGRATRRPGSTRPSRALRDEQKIALELPDTHVPAGRTVFPGDGAVRLGGRPLFAGDGVDLAIRGPERIALTGPNGAGKSTLLRLIHGELEPGQRRDQARRRPDRLPVPAAGPAGPRPHRGGEPGRVRARDAAGASG